MQVMRGVTFRQPTEDHLVVQIDGDWKLSEGFPETGELESVLAAATMKIARVSFDAEHLGDWDSGLLTFLRRVIDQCSGRGVTVDRDGLPQGVKRLLALATAVPERKGARREAERVGFLARVGKGSLDWWKSTLEMLAFIGEATAALIRVLGGKAKMRRADLLLTLRDSGAGALAIVSLVSALVGLILAFVGAVQLEIFGAQIYVASLVGIAMIRVMGAVMAGIIMSARTATSFAAQLGTMQINEEIDALKTLGISPMEYLVLPRMIGLFLMMPLLGLYADLMGVLGGFIVGVGMLDISPMEYFNQTRASVRLPDLWIGLFQSAVFGVLIALSGCLRGIQCKRSAAAVGDATRSAAVTSIVSIIVATAVITVMCNVLGI
jgi:phospholipid/cholesterol/gamma-HCH transport system permease protein